MARRVLYCARSLPDYLTDDAVNTKLIHDARAVIRGATTGQELQAVRQSMDPGELPFDELSLAEQLALTARVGLVQTAMGTYVPPFPVTPPQGRR